jgi:hypothetical protein
MDPPHASRRYGGKAQALHWIVAGLIVTQYVLARTAVSQHGVSWLAGRISGRQRLSPSTAEATDVHVRICRVLLQKAWATPTRARIAP